MSALRQVGVSNPDVVAGLREALKDDDASLVREAAKNPKGVGLVVFTGRLRPNQHSLEVFNQRVGKLQQSLP